MDSRALSQRQKWAAEDMLGGGKEAAALLVSSLVHAALVGKQLQSQSEVQEFKEAAKPVLDFLLEQVKARLAKECSQGVGYSVVLFSLGSALRLVAA